MWTNLESKSLSDLSQFSSIYIGGGNTFHLLNILRKTGFDELLKAYINQKKLFTEEVLEPLFGGAIF
ncbi:peptidase E [Bacillus iocasae]|uniref:Peptidase E n=1 Tax=Priestia iocasae TaxID=2291674 RepID=A0ABS2QXF1_9BACI|nr:peptidase E [Metabacillus iocasae]